MTWEQIQTTLIGLAVSAIVGLIGKWIGMKRAEETRSAVTWAIEQGVALAAHKFQDLRTSSSGQQKKIEAIQVAESLAPRAMKKLDDDVKSTLVDAVYARMKASLPHPSTYAVGSEGMVKPLPPPAKVPRA